MSGIGATGLRDEDVQGRRLGLPAEGAGSVAATGARAVAFIVDLVLASLIGALLAGALGTTPLQRNLVSTGVFAAMTVVTLMGAGQSPGMWLLGLRVRSLRDTRPTLGFVPAALRTALLVLLVPALITDRDGRGLHDRAAGTVVVRA